MVINIKTSTVEDYVYVGRAGHGQDGYFGNPVKIGKECPICRLYHQTRGATLSCFEVYARRRLERDSDYRRRVKGLHGKVLGCFCAPLRCHGEILVMLAEELSSA